MTWFLLLYAYVGATCAALAWGYTDNVDEGITRHVLVVVCLVWPLILPVVLVQAWKKRQP